MAGRDSRGKASAPGGAAASAPALPTPSPRTGITWRALGPEDAPGLHDLVSTCESFDNPPYRTSLEEVTREFHQAKGVDPATNSLAAITSMGQILAYGRVNLEATGRSRRAFIGGAVHPTLRGHGVGTEILAWQVARARQLLAENSGGGDITTYVEEGMDQQASLLTAVGLHPIRYYSELRRDLRRPIPQPQLTGSLVLEPWTNQFNNQIFDAYSEAFQGRGGALAHDLTSWREVIAAREPHWSFIVMDRSSDRVRVAGFLMSTRYEQDWEALGYTAGTTEFLGVLPAWRGRGLATALLSSAMRAYRDDGMDFASLGLESGEPSEPFGLYSSLGYEVTHRSALWSLSVD